MPLVLITGPANAAKAGEVLGRFRAPRPRSPLPVVPTAADVDHFQRELAAGGALVGGSVVPFGSLVRSIAEAVGVEGRPLGPVARDRVVVAAVRDAGLRELRASAESRGFAAAAGALIAELGRAGVSPDAVPSALRVRAGAAPPRPPGPRPGAGRARRALPRAPRPCRPRRRRAARRSRGRRPRG